MIPKSVRRHLIKNLGKYIIGAAGLGTVTGPVVVPPIIEAGKDILASPDTTEFVTREEFDALRQELGLVPPPVVTITEQVAEPATLTCPATLVPVDIEQYCSAD